jgi:hypothetical protein
MDKNQIRTKKYDTNDEKFWALSEWYDEVTNLRSPLDSMATYPINPSPN